MEREVDVWKPDVAQLFGARSPATPRPDVAALLSLSTLYLPGSRRVSGDDAPPWTQLRILSPYCEELFSPHQEGIPEG